MSFVEGITIDSSVEQHEKAQKRRKNVSSKDMISSFDVSFAKVELAVSEIWEKVKDHKEGIEGLKKELYDDMQSTLNQVINALTKSNEKLEAMVVALQSEMKEIKGKLSTCKATVANTVTTTQLFQCTNVPRPKSFNESRSIKEVNNFLYSIK